MQPLCRWFLPLLFAVPLILAARPHGVHAATDTWQAVSDDWSVPGDWSTGNVPAMTTTAYIANSGTVNVTSLATQDICQYLYVGDANSANTGTVQMSSGKLVAQGLGTTGGSEYLGGGGATFNQLGGTNQFSQFLYVGYNSANGSYYTLGGSGEIVLFGGTPADGQYVGYNGTGVFTQTGGVNQLFMSSLYLAGGASSSLGTYNLSGSGSLLAFLEDIGAAGSGVFNQSGGTNTATAAVEVGSNLSTTSTYSLGGSGLLAPSVEYVGVNGAGVFNQTGGTNSVSYSANVTPPGFLGVGLNTGSSGTYNLSAGSLGSYTLSVGESGGAAFNQSGGTNSVTNQFTLGQGLAPAVYNFTGGQFIVPDISGAGGTFNFGGGTLVAEADFSTSQAMTLTGSGGNAFVDTGGYTLSFSGGAQRTGRIECLRRRRTGPQRQQHVHGRNGRQRRNAALGLAFRDRVGDRPHGRRRGRLRHAGSRRDGCRRLASRRDRAGSRTGQPGDLLCWRDRGCRWNCGKRQKAVGVCATTIELDTDPNPALNGPAADKAIGIV